VSLGSTTFLFAPNDDTHAFLGTGVGAWESKLLRGYEFAKSSFVFFVLGPRFAIGGPEFDWDIENGGGSGWAPVRVGPDARSGAFAWGEPAVRLVPSPLPPMMQELRQIGTVRHASINPPDDPATARVEDTQHIPELAAAWDALLTRQHPVTVAAHARERIIVDLGDYYCAYPQLGVSGGAASSIRLHWAESLFDGAEGNAKGHRDLVNGKYFRGVGDLFKPDGGPGRRFEPLWWQAGRYIELVVRTAEQPLVIDQLQFRETRYPLEAQSRFSFSDRRMDAAVPIMVRALQMCTHETYVDCPYYEQLMYVGDSRLEALATYAISPDSRLPAQSLRLFDASRTPDGLTGSRYPTHNRQVIPGFSLWWIAMVYDHALWRGNRDLIRRYMPGVRHVLDHFRNHQTPDGVVRVPDGWHFVDWVQGWPDGVPPAGGQGVCGILNWQYVMVLRMAAELETWLGESELATRDRRLADGFAHATRSLFWDQSRGLFADDFEHRHFSEHAQCLAILSATLGAAHEAQLGERMLQATDLSPTTIYFTHYLFEAMVKTGHIDAVFDRLNLWFTLADNGFKTTFEAPGDTRSDCHAWGAHPLYHYYASILGVRPAAMGFESVVIDPHLGPLTSAEGRLVHPRGTIDVAYARQDGRTSARIVLPDGVTACRHQSGATTRPANDRYLSDVSSGAGYRAPCTVMYCGAPVRVR
jgi:hypothetical protein